MTVLLLWPVRLRRRGNIDSLSGIFRRKIVRGGSGPDKREVERNLAITCGILEDLLGMWEEGWCCCTEVGEVESEAQTVNVEDGEGCVDSPVYEPVWEVGRPALGCSGNLSGIDKLQCQNEERAVREESLGQYHSTMVVCHGQCAVHSRPYILPR